MLVAGFDPLRDEGVDYAKRMIEAGNRVTLVNYEGMIHGFYLMGAAVDAAKRAIAQSAQALREAFAARSQSLIRSRWRSRSVPRRRTGPASSMICEQRDDDARRGGSMGLEGKVAWITGAGTGIGLAGAQALAKAGAVVVMSGRRADVLEREARPIRTRRAARPRSSRWT